MIYEIKPRWGTWWRTCAVGFLCVLPSAVLCGYAMAAERRYGGSDLGEVNKGVDTEATNCEALRSHPIDGGEITAAYWVSAANRAAVFPSLQLPGQIMPFCKVTAVLTPTTQSRIGVEVWLPTKKQWNGRFKGVGNGGLGGSIPYAALVGGLMQGYATAATDTGHDGRSAPGVFALDHPEGIVDYAHRAIHLTAVSGKALAAQYYDSQPTFTYFEGCSQGGQEGLMEAQRYPEDYDGIIAGDPDYNQTHHEVGAHLWVVSTLYSDPRSRLSAADARLIGDAVNKACDKLDGVEDGVLEDPRRCHFDPSVLQCRGGKNHNCLTQPQVIAVRKLWAGPGKTIHPSYYPGLERGGEAELWSGWIVAETPEQNIHALLGIPFFKYFVFGDPSWNFRAFDYVKDPTEIDRRLAPVMDAVDTDLIPFMNRGGKLIQYHGFNDPDVPPQSSILYYEAVWRGLRRKNIDQQTFYRLFMVPGMGHCGGGPGANSFDMMAPLKQWVEQSVAPNLILATKYLDDDPTKTPLRIHPLCPYPKVARYKGQGNPDEVENYVCAGRRLL